MKIFSTLLLFFLSSVAYSQYLISSSLIAQKSDWQVENYLSGNGWNTSQMNIHGAAGHKIVYRTIDQFGDSTTASGAVYIPTNYACESLPMIAYHHGTEFQENIVPSHAYYQARAYYFSSTGYIAVLPDYLGMGDHTGLHPYQHWESQATATTDLMRAVMEFIEDLPGYTFNGQIFLTGYSQGGHAAMSTHKYIQENGLENEFNIVASAPLSGAYNLSGAQFDFIFDGDSTYISPFIPYILASYQLVYGNIYNSFDEIYDAPYASQIENYLNDGTTSFYQWNTMLPANYYHFMQDSVLNNLLADPAHPINEALQLNDVHNWKPEKPVRMIYCSSDDVVSGTNSIVARDTMQALGATDVMAINIYPPGSHNVCFNHATEYALIWFDSLKNNCGELGLPEVGNGKSLSVYPNPAQNILEVKCEFNEQDIKSVKILDLSGKIMGTYKDLKSITVDKLQSGNYILEVNLKDGTQIHEKFIIR